MDTEIPKQWSEKIEQQKASGKSAAAWGFENQAPYKNFIKWRKRLSSVENLSR